MDIWNPWHGCRKISEGCEHCYMYYLDAQHDRDGSEIYKVKGNFNLPLRRDRDGRYKIPDGSVVHVCLTSDFFLEEADEWRPEVWRMIHERRGVTFVILTKRAERIAKCLPQNWYFGYPNVELRVTAENQRRADERVPILLSVPAKRRGIMTAPLLEEISLRKYLRTGKINYVIADGENYEGARPCRYEWVRRIFEECVEYGVEFEFAGTGNVFVKDGKTYSVPKAYQRVMALRSGLFNPPRENVDVPVVKKCAACKMKDTCRGCRGCGKCSEFKKGDFSK